MSTFKAYRTFEDNGVVSSRFVTTSIDELDHGEVVVRTKYSTINYKDALSHNGTGRIMRKFPCIAGIDMAGTVEASSDPRWKKGDKVIVHGYDLGVAHDGGYAEYVRVPAGWVVRRPESMTAFDAMTLGTAGYTAGLAIELMQHNGLAPANGPVAVTGATGGVGSVAVEVLAKLGYDILAWLLSLQKIGGVVGAVGLAAGYKLNTTVMPFILRGVHLLGINSSETPMALRQKIWNKLAVEWRPDRVHDQVRTIDFEELPTHFDAYLKGLVRGRTVVRIAADTHGG